MNPAIIVNLNKYKNYLYLITLNSRIKIIMYKYGNWYINLNTYFLVFNNLRFEKNWYWKTLINKSLYFNYIFSSLNFIIVLNAFLVYPTKPPHTPKKNPQNPI